MKICDRRLHQHQPGMDLEWRTQRVSPNSFKSEWGLRRSVGCSRETTCLDGVRYGLVHCYSVIALSRRPTRNTVQRL